MNYPYVNGQIKVIESKILGKNEFSKLIKTQKTDFMKTLIDLGYGSSGPSLESVINQELKNVKNLLDEISPQKKYTDLFFLASDALNIKALIKRQVFGINHLNIFVDTGVIDEKALNKAIFEEDYSLLKKEHRKLLTNIIETVKDEDSPRVISAKIDNLVYQFIIDNLGFGVPALKTYFEASIDFANLITYVRIKKLGWSLDEFGLMFLENGKIPQSVFEEMFNQTNDLQIRTLREYYDEKLSKILKEYYEVLNLNLLERRLDDLILKLVKEYQYDSFGIGPIIYYYLKKQAEAKNIRAIYASSEIELIDLLDY